MHGPRPRGLVAFDLDGTLLRGNTACELIAAAIGRLPDMRQLEADHSRRAVAASRLEMARWYQGHTRKALCDGLRAATWAPGAHEAIAKLKHAGHEVVIASITWQFAVGWFARSLGVRHFAGSNISKAGTVNHMWPAGKATWLRNVVRDLGVPRARVAAVGDSAGDYHLLRAAALRFFVGREAPSIPRVVHLPNADVRVVADTILQLWTD